MENEGGTVVDTAEKAYWAKFFIERTLNNGNPVIVLVGKSTKRK